METVHTEQYKNHTIKIVLDDDTQACNPREWDNVGTMVCHHRNYNLGDDQKSSVVDVIQENCTEDEARKIILTKCKGKFSEYRYLVRRYDTNDCLAMLDEFELTPDDFPESIFWLPLYLYDHSGITINTTGFSCSWDSRCLGFIYTTKSKLESEKIPDWNACLKDEVSTYNDYLTGNCYGFIIEDSEGNEIDSCWGFLGDYEKFALVEARSSLN